MMDSSSDEEEEVDDVADLATLFAHGLQHKLDFEQAFNPRPTFNRY